MGEDSQIYICEGTCEGEIPTPVILGEQKKTPSCQDPDCTKYKEPLTKYFVCKDCLERYLDGEEHLCS